MENLELFEDEDFEPTPRKQSFEPKNRYEFCQAIANTIRKPIGYVLSSTKHWPLEWFFSVQSECKHIRDPLSKVKYLQWFIREAKTK